VLRSTIAARLTTFHRISTASFASLNASLEALSTKFGKRVEAANLAVLGAVIEDDVEILLRTFRSNKNPKLIICGIAPRDFLICANPSSTATPVQLFSDYYPVPRLLQFASGIICAAVSLQVDMIRDNQLIASYIYWKALLRAKVCKLLTAFTLNRKELQPLQNALYAKFDENNSATFPKQQSKAEFIAATLELLKKTSSDDRIGLAKSIKPRNNGV
jgi:hypothetical protein